MVHAFRATMVACGATPAMPIPLTRPAIVVATWVPWPSRSWTAALLVQSPLAISEGSAVGVSVKMNEHELRHVDGARQVGVGEVDAAVDDADLHAGSGRQRRWRRRRHRCARMSHWQADSGSGPAATPKNAAQFADACAGLSAPGVAAPACTAMLRVKASTAPSTTSFLMVSPPVHRTAGWTPTL